MYQQLTIAGRLVSEPVFKVVNGTELASFRVVSAVSPGVSLFVNVSVWGKAASSAHAHLDRGSPVLVSGRPKVNAYISAEGLALPSVDLNTSSITFLPDDRREDPELAGIVETHDRPF